jgi:hypothetical protein
MASFIFALDSKYNGGIMKKALIILALITLLLPSCSSEKDAKIAELTTKIEQLTKEKAQDTFKKKIECKKYEAEVAINLAHDKYQMDFLQSVFYSSKRNSCLMAVRSMYMKDKGEILYIKDILTHETIWSQDYHPIQQAGVAAAKLNEQIKLLE